MPETRYAQSGELSIAYQTIGEGPLDILFIPGFVSNVELIWEVPGFSHLLTRLSELGRLTFFDKRGTGCSDRSLGTGSAEDRMDDVRAVADAAGLERPVVMGISEGGPLAVLYASVFPERVRSLVLWGTFARVLDGPDYEGTDPAVAEQFFSFIHDQWGTGRPLEAFLGGADDDLLAVLARYERQTASPSTADTIIRHNAAMDVRYALSAVSASTLVLHHTDDPIVPVKAGRYLAEHIPNARMAEFPGDVHASHVAGNEDPLIDAIAEFITGAPVRHEEQIDRVLATVLFTDIVDSTAQAAALGDKDWRTVLEHHDAAAARAIDDHRGQLVKTTGDGVLATFDGPGRGIRAARAVQEAVRSLDIEVRAGLHTGEIERRDDDIAGIGVHIGARVGALAGPGEVLVTNTVKDLVIGSDLTFDDRGEHTLKGVPGDWHLWAAN
jgi:class 3 adenylate cyclase